MPRSRRRPAAPPTRCRSITVTNLSRALRDLKERGVWVLGADAGGESLFAADVSRTGRVGARAPKAQGLRRLTRERCDRIVGIPLAGTVESLNVSVAAGICLYATRAHGRSRSPLPRSRPSASMRSRCSTRMTLCPRCIR